MNQAKPEPVYDYSVSDDVKQEQARRATEEDNKMWERIIERLLT
jgi:hypothetical protein